MSQKDDEGNTNSQRERRYYYHADHLGSAQLITDWKGNQYEHIEYTPYGELWVEEVSSDVESLPFRFTGKEYDEETGLYYYGARYLDPKYSRWLSGDPALGDYIPKAPINDEAKKHNQNLPGMGGVFNAVNLHLYHYAGNNPVKYTDPTGKFDVWQFIGGAMQTIGGVIEMVGGAITSGTFVGALVFIDGGKNVYDGVFKIGFACIDEKFAGCLPEASGMLAEYVGADKSTVNTVKSLVGAVESLPGLVGPNTGLTIVDKMGKFTSLYGFGAGVYDAYKGGSEQSVGPNWEIKNSARPSFKQQVANLKAAQQNASDDDARRLGVAKIRLINEIKAARDNAQTPYDYFAAVDLLKELE